MTDREKEAFIGGIEFARDWNLDIPPDDLRLYERLIQERTKKRMNKVILMGRLTRDPNVRYTQQNGSQESMCVARYTLAVDRRGARDGQQSADFISCVAFGKNGEFAEKYLKQGTKIAATGRIQTGSYTNRDGQKVYTTDVVIEEQEFAESKKAAGEQAENAGYTDAGDGFMNIPDDIDGDLPFM